MRRVTRARTAGGGGGAMVGWIQRRVEGEGVSRGADRLRMRGNPLTAAGMVDPRGQQAQTRAMSDDDATLGSR